jgi:hypothetical protein
MNSNLYYIKSEIKKLLFSFEYLPSSFLIQMITFLKSNLTIYYKTIKINNARIKKSYLG